jgi:hypothetical protein
MHRFRDQEPDLRNAARGPLGIGPFQTFKSFNRFAWFKTLQIAAVQGSIVQRRTGTSTFREFPQRRFRLGR